MAYASITDTHAAAPRAGFFTRFTAAIAQIAERQSRADQVAALQRLNDSQLAERGLRRDDIVRHVFADRFFL